MKVLIVFNHPAPYKVRFFNELGKELDLHVIFERHKASDRNPLFYSENAKNFTLHEIKGLNIGKENHCSRDVIKHIKNNKYDLIIMNGYSTFTEMKTIRYLKKHHIPYAFYANGGTVKKEPKCKSKIKTKYISGASAYFSSGKETTKYLIHYGADPDKVYEYPYSTIFECELNLNPISKQDKKKYWENKNINGDLIFVSLTSFIKRKNNMLLLNTWKNMDKDKILVLVGDGVEKKKYQKFIKKNHLNNVFLLPFLPHDKSLELLRNADYGLYVSHYDIYGHVINESLSQGLSIIASNNMNATKQLIKDGVNGIIYTDNADLLAQIRTLMNSNFYEEAIKTAKENTIEEMTKTHVKILKELIK
jgi:hypothetical protein